MPPRTAKLLYFCPICGVSHSKTGHLCTIGRNLSTTSPSATSRGCSEKLKDIVEDNIYSFPPYIPSAVPAVNTLVGAAVMGMNPETRNAESSSRGPPEERVTDPAQKPSSKSSRKKNKSRSGDDRGGFHQTLTSSSLVPLPPPTIAISLQHTPQSHSRPHSSSPRTRIFAGLSLDPEIAAHCRTRKMYNSSCGDYSFFMNPYLLPPREQQGWETEGGVRHGKMTAMGIGKKIEGTVDPKLLLVEMNARIVAECGSMGEVGIQNCGIVGKFEADGMESMAKVRGGNGEAPFDTVISGDKVREGNEPATEPMETGSDEKTMSENKTTVVTPYFPHFAEGNNRNEDSTWSRSLLERNISDARKGRLGLLIKRSLSRSNVYERSISKRFLEGEGRQQGEKAGWRRRSSRLVNLGRVNYGE